MTVNAAAFDSCTGHQSYTENNSTRVQRVKPAAGGYTYPPPNLTLYQRVRLPAYRRLSTRVYCVPNPHRMGTQPTHRRQPTRSQRVHNPHMAYYLRCVGWELAFCEYKYPLVGCPNQLEGKVPSSGGVQKTPPTRRDSNPISLILQTDALPTAPQAT